MANRIVHIAASWLAVIATVLAPCFADESATSPLARYEFSRIEMATTFRIVLYAPTEAAARDASNAAFDRVTRLNEVLSDYDPKSEASRLSAASPSAESVRVSDDLWAMLSTSQRFAEETDGAFDVTVGPYTRLWRRSRRQERLPSAEALAEAKAAVGYKFVKLDPQAKTAQLLRPKMRLDFGGIGKGFAADEALSVLKARGITQAMVAASGDLAIGDAPPGEKGWRIGVAPLEAAKMGEEAKPSVFLRLVRCGVSTSGDTFQHVVIDGKRYSHIVDPRTGVGLTEQAMVTVVAPNATTSDALDTAFSIVGVERAQAILKRHPGTEMLFVRKDGEKGEKITSVESPGFKNLKADAK